MYEVLEQMFGRPVMLEPFAQTGELPVYLQHRRRFWRVEMQDAMFLMAELPSDERYTLKQLKKQQEKLQELLRLPVAFCFQQMTRVQRDELLRAGVPFLAVSDSGKIKQCYLPFLGILLQEKFDRPPAAPPEKFTPAAQMLFLYLLYHGQQRSSKTKAAQALQLTKTSITRASASLSQCGLISEKRCGREVYMQPSQTGLPYYRKALPYLIDPVREKRMVLPEPWMQKLPLAGESALSHNSMLNPPAVQVRACSRQELQDHPVQSVDPLWNNEAKLLCLEVWKYPPQLFAKENAVDPVSLACSLHKVQDERIEDQLEQLLKEFVW